MKMHGYCTGCRRFRQVRVTSAGLFSPGAPTGTCDVCESVADAERRFMPGTRVRDRRLRTEGVVDRGHPVEAGADEALVRIVWDTPLGPGTPTRERASRLEVVR